MKTYLFVLIVMLTISCIGHTQGVGIGTSAPHPSARLHVSGSGKGILIPRMTTAGMNDIASPAKGLMIYDSTRHELMVNIGTGTAPNWKPVNQNSSWNTQGNAGTNANTHFIGTTDNVPLHFRINNKPAGKLDSIKQNTFLGFRSGQKSTGNNNTAMGYKAFGSNGNNVAILNTAIGSEALRSNTSGQSNSAVGAHAMKECTTGSANTALGAYAMNLTTEGSNNVAVGDAAMYSNTTGDINTAIGGLALYDNTQGFGNAAVGYKALRENTTGAYNTAVGTYSLNKNLSGNFNCAVGYSSLSSNTTGAFNIGIGIYALEANISGSDNIAVGYSAMENNSVGTRNVAIGLAAMQGNTIGSYNQAIGYNALASNSSGGQNTAIGLQTLMQTTASNYNTAVGMDAGRYHNLGWNNTFIGSNANAYEGDIFNGTAIGEGAIVTASNQVRIGNFYVTSIGGFANWSNVSDARFKKNVRENVHGLDFIMRLRPVTYHLDTEQIRQAITQDSTIDQQEMKQVALAEKATVLQTGFIAQEVEQAARELGYEFSGVDAPKHDEDYYALRYAEFVVPLVKAMQEQQEQIDQLKREVERLSN